MLSISVAFLQQMMLFLEMTKAYGQKKRPAMRILPDAYVHSYCTYFP